LTPLKLVAVGLSLAGCVFVAQAHTAEAWGVNLAGILVGLATGLAFAFYSLAGRWSAKRFASAWTVTAYGFAFATLGLGVLASAQMLMSDGARAIAPGFFSLGARWDGWLILFVLAAGPSIGGFGLYTLSLRYLPASIASLVASLEPALTALIAMPALGQYLSGLQWFGAGLILLAVVLAQSDARPEASP
jgi:drug/metabolite transporter (DMT)-like permease